MNKTQPEQALDDMQKAAEESDQTSERWARRRAERVYTEAKQVVTEHIGKDNMDRIEHMAGEQPLEVIGLSRAFMQGQPSPNQAPGEFPDKLC